MSWHRQSTSTVWSTAGVQPLNSVLLLQSAVAGYNLFCVSSPKDYSIGHEGLSELYLSKTRCLLMVLHLGRAQLSGVSAGLTWTHSCTHASHEGA